MRASHKRKAMKRRTAWAATMRKAGQLPRTTSPAPVHADESTHPDDDLDARRAGSGQVNRAADFRLADPQALTGYRLRHPERCLNGRLDARGRPSSRAQVEMAPGWRDAARRARANKHRLVMEPRDNRDKRYRVKVVAKPQALPNRKQRRQRNQRTVRRGWRIVKCIRADPGLGKIQLKDVDDSARIRRAERPPVHANAPRRSDAICWRSARAL